MNLKKTVSILLCMLMLLFAASPVWTAFAAAETVTVTVLYVDGGKIRPFRDLVVADGAAEQYGYAVIEKDHNGKPIESATVLDALVCAHAAAYGAEFTAETKDTYFYVSGGYMTSAFGESKSLGFTVNDVQPNDGILVTSEWGSYYTGYAADEARIESGDVITLFSYADLQYWMDYYAAFAEKELNVKPEESFTVSASGYCAAFYGCSEQSVIDANTIPMEDAEICWTKDFETYTTAGTLDEKGELTVTAPAEEGTWYLVVRGETAETPVIANYCTVNVKAETVEPDEPAQAAQWFFTDLRTIFTWKNRILTIGLKLRLHDLNETTEDVDCVYAIQLCFDGSQDFFTLIKGEI